jgi:hypothetical protein
VPPPGGKGMFVIDGWAVSSCDAVDLSLTVDAKMLLTGHPYLRRADVKERFPSLPSAEFAGFSVPFDMTALGPGFHEAVVTARACGVEKVLQRASFEVSRPTSAWIAASVLALLLVALPFALGALARRLPPVAWRAAWTPWAIGLGWLLSFFAILCGPRFGSPEIPVEPGLFSPLANWDGRWYLGIAHEGYPIGKPGAFAFFPLFPLLLRGLAFLPVPERLAASLLNGFFFLLAMACLRRLYRDRDQAVLIYALLPFSFFFAAVYTEALFVLLLTSFVLSVRRDRGLPAAALGALAALTRVNGVLLGFFVIEPLWRGKRRVAILAAAGPILGLTLWSARLGLKTGDPLRFLHSAAEFGRSTSFHPGRLLDSTLWALRSGNAQAFWELGFLLIVLAGSAGLLLERRWAEGLFSAAIVLAPLYTERLTSLNRYALAAFPAFMFLGERVRPRVLAVLLPVEVGLLLVYAARFGRQVFMG